jgi:type VI secretion system protein ImpH
MASTRWPPATSLEDSLFAEPERFDVFQLVRLLRVRDSSRPQVAQKLQQLLRWRLMSGEADTRSFASFASRLRFRADLSPEFPGSEVTGCRRVDTMANGGRLAAGMQALALAQGALDGLGALSGLADSAGQLDAQGTAASADALAAEAFNQAGVVEIRTPNYVVASELGPLPEPFVEWVRDRLRDDDQTFAAFLDVFNHRINVLRHQLKASQDVALDYALPQDTLQADFLASIAGMVSLDAEAQIALPRRAWLGMTATLADPRRSAAAGLTALRQYLGMPTAQLVPLVGNWRPLSASQWPSLGKQATLGGDAVLGTQVWDEMAGVRLCVPEVDYGRLCGLLPPPWTPSRSHGSHGVQHSGGAHAPHSDAHPTARDDSPTQASEPAPAPIRQSPAEAAADSTEPLNGYDGLSEMVRLLFDRRVDCEVELTVRASQLPQAILTARPGTGDTANGTPAVAATRPGGTRYRGLLLGQTAWLAAAEAQAGNAADELRKVSFTISGDPVGAFQ